MECWSTGMLGMGHPGSLTIPPFHDSTIPVFPFQPRAASHGTSPIQGFAFLIPAPSACARSLLVPGTCDLTHRRTDASDLAVPCAWNSPTIPAP